MKINKFHLKQLNYVLQRTKGLGDGGSLLDNSIVLFGSGMTDHTMRITLATIRCACSI